MYIYNIDGDALYNPFYKGTNLKTKLSPVNVSHLVPPQRCLLVNSTAWCTNKKPLQYSSRIGLSESESWRLCLHINDW